MDTASLRLQARRYARVTSTGIPDSHVQDLTNDGLYAFSQDVYGFPKEDYLTLTPLFDARTNFAIRVTITGGTNAMAATDVPIVAIDRTDVTGTIIATSLQAKLRTAIGAGANATVTWSLTTWRFTVDTIDGTRLQITSPSSDLYVDAVYHLFGETVDETEAAASYTSGLPPNALIQAALPSGFMKMTRVEWNGQSLEQTTSRHVMSPSGHGTPTHYYIRGTNIRLYPSPSKQEMLHIWYKGDPDAITSFDTDLPAEIPTRCHKGLMWWVASQMAGERHENELSNRLYGQYWRERSKYLVNYNNQITKMDEGEAYDTFNFTVNTTDA